MQLPRLPLLLVLVLLLQLPYLAALPAALLLPGLPAPLHLQVLTLTASAGLG
jgi:hypothetical protein